MNRLRWLLAMSLVVFTGCTDDEHTLVEIENVGALCIVGEGEGESTTYIENAPVEVRVELQGCAASGGYDVMTSCTIEQDGSTLHVTAMGSYWRTPPGQASHSACVAVMPKCTSEPLAAGTYTIEYRGETTTFDVPSTGSAAQIGTFEWHTHECTR